MIMMIYLISQKIKRYTSDINFDAFITDDKTKDAVVRNFEIIGEAANRIDPDFKDKFPEIESMKQTNIILVSYCGFYCGACPKYTKGQCEGCRGDTLFEIATR